MLRNDRVVALPERERPELPRLQDSGVEESRDFRSAPPAATGKQLNFPDRPHYEPLRLPKTTRDLATFRSETVASRHPTTCAKAQTPRGPTDLAAIRTAGPSSSLTPLSQLGFESLFPASASVVGSPLRSPLEPGRTRSRSPPGRGSPYLTEPQTTRFRYADLKGHVGVLTPRGMRFRLFVPSGAGSLDRTGATRPFGDR